MSNEYEDCVNVPQAQSVAMPIDPIRTKVLALESGGKYISLIEKTRMVAKGKSHAMMSMGSVGVAKSTLIQETLKEEGLREGKDFVFVRGYSTPLALYEKLYQNREEGKIVVIDDCDVVLKNKTCLDLLKAVLDDKYQRHVCYATKKQSGSLPSSFIFTGSVIFITNYQPKENDIHFLAIQDRCLVQKLYLTTREKLEYLEKIIVPNDYKNTSLDDRLKIFAMMKEIVFQGGVHFSYRTYFQMMDFFIHDPKHFEIHLRELLPCDTDLTQLLQLMRERPNEPRFWKSEFMNQTKKSARTYFNLLSKARAILPKVTKPTKSAENELCE
ncbi:hypothetical protein WDW86_10235 [Bdellovibrionota bacterium FG-2]